RPPVALLAHAVDEPGRSAFWPLAEFSPEWVAIRWALEHEVPARFIDLPATHTLAGRKDPQDELGGGGGDGRGDDGDSPGCGGVGEGDAFAPFLVLEEAMTALREAYGSGGHDRDLVREAYMRLQVRAAQRDFGDTVAVVCGAWHVPALRQKTAVAADRALVKG